MKEETSSAFEWRFEICVPKGIQVHGFCLFWWFYEKIWSKVHPKGKCQYNLIVYESWINGNSPRQTNSANSRHILIIRSPYGLNHHYYLRNPPGCINLINNSDFNYSSTNFIHCVCAGVFIHSWVSDFVLLTQLTQYLMCTFGFVDTVNRNEFCTHRSII